MNPIDRSTDVISNLNDLEVLGIFLKFPAFMGCVSSDIKLDQNFDMNFCISKTSGMIQINPILPLNLIYQSSHGSGTIGKTWSLHHESFANFISQYDPKSVFEIGGGTGILSIKYNIINNINWTILEPNPTPDIKCIAEYITGFFHENIKLTTEFDSVVHSHIIEHVYNPDKFLSDLSKFIGDGKTMFFSIPNLAEMFKRYYTNCINFEHTLLLTEEYVEYLLAKHKFKILSKQYFLSDHSIFYATQRDDAVTPCELPSNIYLSNKELFRNYIDYFDKLIVKFNNIIQSQDTEEIYLFGGHVFSQFLINRGLDTRKIKSIIDNDPNKHGKRLYGSSLNVESPKVLIGKKNPYVILKVANYTDEIKHDILKNINSTTMFIE